MKNYYKIILGPKSIYAEECVEKGFIGAGYNINQDLLTSFPEDFDGFNQMFTPIYQKANPGKNKIAADLACGTSFTIARRINIGDIVLCPNGKRRFLVAEVTGDYSYHPGEILPHRRSVKWLDVIINRWEVSQELKNATNSLGTSANVTQCATEIESYINGSAQQLSTRTDEVIEDITVFALEKHLEEFLVSNWASTELGKKYDIYEEDGEIVGQQYPSDTGPIDILAISKDKLELLVVELKRGKASDSVIGQIQRYMGYVKAELAEKDQSVKGVIIALEDDTRIKRALSVTNNIEFYRYQVSFKLFKNI